MAIGMASVGAAAGAVVGAAVGVVAPAHALTTNAINIIILAIRNVFISLSSWRICNSC
jgi:hypothetical protein